MSDADDIDDIRERKRRELEQRVDGTQPGQGGAATTDSTPVTEASDSPVHVTGSGHLDDLLTEHRLVLVDFYADWCGPCKMLEPVVEELAAETPTTVAKVDVDVHQGLAGQYQVQGVPTLYLFVDGDPVERLVGAQDGATLRQLIDQYT